MLTASGSFSACGSWMSAALGPSASGPDLLMITSVRVPAASQGRTLPKWPAAAASSPHRPIGDQVGFEGHWHVRWFCWQNSQACALEFGQGLLHPLTEWHQA